MTGLRPECSLLIIIIIIIINKDCMNKIIQRLLYATDIHHCFVHAEPNKLLRVFSSPLEYCTELDASS